MPVTHLDPKSVVEYLAEYLEKAERGEVREFTLIAKMSDGNTQICASGSYNCHEMAGKILDHAIMRLGYQPRMD